MSENIKPTAPSREEIDNMSTQELMGLIRQDAEMTNNSSSDEELIFYILEVLAEREEMRDVVLHKNPEEAHEKFQKLYLVPVEDGISTGKTKDLQHSGQPQAIRFPKWLRSIATVAAVLAVVVIAGSVTIKAAGLDPWTLFATWTKDIFYFSTGETQLPEIPEPDVSALKEMLEKHSITIPAVPHWLPEGYELIDVYEQASPRITSISAEYCHGKDVLLFSLQIYADTASVAVAEKDEAGVETHIIGGQVHYIFSNNGNTTASWTVENHVLSIYGHVSIEDMKQIIASFYEGN